MMLAERKSPSWSSMTSLQIAASAGNRVSSGKRTLQPTGANNLDNQLFENVISLDKKILWKDMMLIYGVLWCVFCTHFPYLRISGFWVNITLYE